MTLADLDVIEKRCPAIAGRYRDRSPVMATFADALVDDGAAYRESRKAVRIHLEQVRDLSMRSKLSITALHTALRVSRARVAADVPEFGSGGASRADAPSAVLAEAGHMIDVLREQASDRVYAASVLEELVPLHERAGSDWTLSQDALARLQTLRGVSREKAQTFVRTLTQFRNALRALVGREHRDHHLLRTIRVSRAADDPDADETPPELTDDEPPSGTSNGSGGTPSGSPTGTGTNQAR